jgi:hypothetical protein
MRNLQVWEATKLCIYVPKTFIDEIDSFGMSHQGRHCDGLLVIPIESMPSISTQMQVYLLVVAMILLSAFGIASRFHFQEDR